MKKIFKLMAWALCAATALGFAACSDDTDAEKDQGATPVIKYCRPCDAALSDSLIVKASLGAHLCFVGDNLGDVQQVWFNDQKCKLNPTMVTSHTIILDIPNVIPGEVSNIARFITSTGIEVEYPFEVVVPGPRVDKISCEYAPAGTTATIEGVYFVDDPNVPMVVTFPNGQNANIKEYTQTSITFEVPECTVEGPITVSTIYGEGESGFHYLDTRGMLFDFDVDGLTGLGISGAQCWHARPVKEDEYSLSGAYMEIGDGATPLSSTAYWDDGNYFFQYWAGSWNTPTDYPEREGERLFDVADFSDFNTKALKFELCIPAAYPWQAGALQLIFSGTDLVSLGNAGTDIYGNTVAGSNNTYFKEANNPGWPRGFYRPWTDAEAFHTDGQWITVKVPIAEFTFNTDGGTASQFLTETSFANLEMIILGGGKEGVECTPVLKIDNVRVVPN